MKQESRTLTILLMYGASCCLRTRVQNCPNVKVWEIIDQVKSEVKGNELKD